MTVMYQNSVQIRAGQEAGMDVPKMKFTRCVRVNRAGTPGRGHFYKIRERKADRQTERQQPKWLTVLRMNSHSGKDKRSQSVC